MTSFINRLYKKTNSSLGNINKITQDDLDLFPYIEDYLKELSILENHNFKGLSEREIYDVFYDFAKILPTNFGLMNNRKFNKHKFYRVRLKKGIGSTEDISISQTFSFPPPSACSQNGRANLKNKSVFYCSNEPYAAILESKPEIGDEGYLSVWGGNSNKTIKVGICLPFDLPAENEWNIMAKDAANKLFKSLPLEAKNKYRHYIKLYEFIANRYILEDKPYYLTSMISNEMLYGELWRDFIIYPSVMAKTNYCNMAFHPNSVIENLKFEKILQFKVHNISSDNIEIMLGKVGYIFNTKLNWREKTKNEINLFSGK